MSGPNVNPDLRHYVLVFLDTGKEDLIELEGSISAEVIQEQWEMSHEGKGSSILIYGSTGEHLYPMARIVKIETIKE